MIITAGVSFFLLLIGVRGMFINQKGPGWLNDLGRWI